MMDGDTTARLLYLSLLLVAVGGWALVEFRRNGGTALRGLLAWGMIGLALVAGYGLWGDIRSQLAPIQQISSGRVEVPRAPDGHFYLTLEVNGQRIRFMADTGASGVVLGRDVARDLGIDPEGLAYTGRAVTANGEVRTAFVRLPEMRLGDLVDRDVPAQVNAGKMDGALLGMDYLGRFRIQIDNQRMVLER